MNRPRMIMETQTGLAMALLLAKRRQEIRFMEWIHIDLDEAIWVKQAGNMKNEKSIVTHLQSLSLQFLNRSRK